MVSENLGDRALLLRELPAELRPWQAAACLRAAAIPGAIEVVSSFATVAVLFEEPGDEAERQAAVMLAIGAGGAASHGARRFEVPVCYELGEDLDAVAGELGRTATEVIAFHTGTEYEVQAIGFRPGFPYLGYLPPELAGVARRPSPRPRVPAGSIGIARDQTGIYPEACPGGWALIGRTPYSIVDVGRAWFPLSPGDRIRFRSIDRNEFERLQGEALA